MVAERLPSVGETSGRVALRERENTVKKMVTAVIGGALLSGSLLGGAAAHADVYYKNCSEARAAGVTPLYESDPGYAPHLDRDSDGIACE